MGQASSGTEIGPPDGLPFDPQEWKLRVAEARARREAVLAGRRPPRDTAAQAQALPVPAPRRNMTALSGRVALFGAGLLAGYGLATLIRNPAPVAVETAGLAPARPTLTLAALDLVPVRPAPGPPPRLAPEAAMLARAPTDRPAATLPASLPTLPRPGTPTLPLTLPTALGGGPQDAPAAAAAPEGPSTSPSPPPGIMPVARPAPAGIDPDLIRSLVEAAIAHTPEP